ncbi:MAG TPA: ribosome silencing factor [Bacteroidales bacterium]|nr:ribosome silencing factor [Bacteroidales bacterium]
MVKTVKDPLVSKLTKALKSKKAQNIVVLDMRETGQNVCDFFVICHGVSGVQTQGIAENAIRELRKEEGFKPIQVEGLSNAEWILVDYGNVVAHIFREDMREFFRLEDLWADAKITTI